VGRKICESEAVLLERPHVFRHAEMSGPQRAGLLGAPMAIRFSGNRTRKRIQWGTEAAGQGVNIG